MLTAGQIVAIIMLLSAFGVDSKTVSTVESILNNQQSVQTQAPAAAQQTLINAIGGIPSCIPNPQLTASTTRLDPIGIGDNNQPVISKQVRLKLSYTDGCTSFSQLIKNNLSFSWKVIKDGRTGDALERGVGGVPLTMSDTGYWKWSQGQDEFEALYEEVVLAPVGSTITIRVGDTQTIIEVK